jgi:hypothetical protein
MNQRLWTALLIPRYNAANSAANPKLFIDQETSILKLNERRTPGVAAYPPCAREKTTPASAATIGLILLVAGAAGSIDCLAQNNGQGTSGIAALQSDSTRIALTAEPGTLRWHNKMVGLGGLKTYVELAGKQATVRFNQGQARVFLMVIDCQRRCKIPQKRRLKIPHFAG